MTPRRLSFGSLVSVRAWGILLVGTLASAQAIRPGSSSLQSPAPREGGGSVSGNSSGQSSKSSAAGASKTVTLRSEVKVSAGKWVTWDYYRMHHGDMVVNALKAVQSGKLPQSALQGLASQSALATLLKGSLPSVPAEKIEPGRSNSPRGSAVVRGTRAASGGGGTSSGASKTLESDRVVEATAGKGKSKGAWSTLSGGGGERLLIPVEAAPASLDFGSEYDGQSRRLLTIVTSLIDGTALAKLPKGSLFEIVAMTTYDGEIERFTPGSDGKTHKSVIRRPEASISKAPWRIAVRSGQDVSVTVRFAPTRAANSPQGAIKDSVEIAVGGGIVNVPLKATGLGVQFGIDATCPDDCVDVIQGSTFQIPLTLNNAGIDSKIDIITTGLPKGITVETVSASLKKGETRNALLNCQVSNDGTATPGQVVMLRCTNGNVVYNLPIVVNVWMPWRDYFIDLSPSDGSFLVQDNLTLRADGTYNNSLSLDKFAVVGTSRWNVEIDIKGIAASLKYNGTIGSFGSTDGGSSGGHMDGLQQQFNALMNLNGGGISGTFDSENSPI